MHLVSWRGCEHVWRRADNEDVQPETGDRQQDGGVTALRRRQVKGLGGAGREVALRPRRPRRVSAAEGGHSARS